MTPLARLLLAALGGIYALKCATLATRSTPRASGLAAFLLAWPGVVPDRFAQRRRSQPIDAGRFLAAWTRLLVGVVSILLLAICSSRIPDTILGLAGMAALLLTIHLGICDLLPWLLRWAGFAVPLLFDRPWLSHSLAEFWSRRWNLAFIEMNQRLFLRPLHHRLGRQGARFALFALSGLLHELAISFPAGRGWGTPLGYFLLQAVLVTIEERRQIASRIWTWFWLIAPAPWLFHDAFRHALVVPFYRWLHVYLTRHSSTWYLSNALYAAAIGHLIVLIASAQVPSRLNWKCELARLGRFNRKAFWTYGGYIVFCIVSFAILTWRLHDAFLAGDDAAHWLAGFIAIFWTIRVLVDTFWFDYRDWPPGNALIVGHALLTTLFCAMAATYWCAVIDVAHAISVPR
jgi:alginate O-acetyltransferase complex protein AlgI